MQQSPDHTDDIRLIEGSLQVMMVICLFKLVQTTKTKRCLFKRCPFTVGKQIAFSWWLPDSARPAQ
jgi:hypothetical protein